MASPPAETALTVTSVGGAAVLLAGAIGVWATSYIKSKLQPVQPKPAEATIVAGAFSGSNDTRLILETLNRIALFSEQDVQATDRVERAVRDLTASNERTGQRAAEALSDSGDETRRIGEAINKLMRNTRPADMPPGRWEPRP